MGQQPSKSAATNASSKAQVEFDEKRTPIRPSPCSPSEDRLGIYSQSSEGSAGLALDKLEAWQNEFDNVSMFNWIVLVEAKWLIWPLVPQSPVLQLSQLVLSNAHPTQGLVSRSTLVADQQIFNLELKGVKAKDGSKGVYPGPVTNQKSSGRCWLFATSMLHSQNVSC